MSHLSLSVFGPTNERDDGGSARKLRVNVWVFLQLAVNLRAKEKARKMSSESYKLKTPRLIVGGGLS